MIYKRRAPGGPTRLHASPIDRERGQADHTNAHSGDLSAAAKTSLGRRAAWIVPRPADLGPRPPGELAGASSPSRRVVNRCACAQRALGGDREHDQRFLRRGPEGWLMVLDGPLHGIRHRRGLPVIGYVKTHHRRMLAREHWVRVPELTGLFAGGGEILRLARPASRSSGSGVEDRRQRRKDAEHGAADRGRGVDLRALAGEHPAGPTPRAGGSCTMLTRWARFRPRWSSFQTTSTSPLLHGPQAATGPPPVPRCPRPSRRPPRPRRRCRTPASRPGDRPRAASTPDVPRAVAPQARSPGAGGVNVLVRSASRTLWRDAAAGGGRGGSGPPGGLRPRTCDKLGRRRDGDAAGETGVREPH